MKVIEFLEHTADIKFRARGKNLEEVFNLMIDGFRGNTLETMTEP